MGVCTRNAKEHWNTSRKAAVFALVVLLMSLFKEHLDFQEGSREANESTFAIVELQGFAMPSHPFTKDCEIRTNADKP